MTGKIPLVLLIDDDPATNFLHRLTVEESGLAEQVDEQLSADGALDYLQQRIADDLPPPQLILIDINMPRMTGWEFLERVTALPLAFQPHIVMVTTSTNPADSERAATIDNIAQFVVKPMEEDDFRAIVENYFRASGD